MPGVKVTTLPRGGAGAVVRAPSGTWFVAGISERGDVIAPIRITGMAEFARYLGDPVSYGTLYDQAATFFAEGGAQMYVARIVGAGATVGTLTLKDQGGGGGVNTLRVDAASPGGWSSRLQVQVTAGGDPNTFRVIVTIDGNVVEDRTNLASPAAAAAAFASSQYVRLTDLGSVTAAPNNNPAVLAATSMTTQGNDDRASITDAGRVAALARLDSSLGTGAVSIPGSTSTTVYNGIIAHCVVNNRIGIAAAARGATAAALTATAAGFGATLGAEYLGLFGPWVLVPDGAGGSKAISPEGYVAAVRNRAHEQEGAWRVPAGDLAAAQYLLGVDAPFDDATADALDVARVSVIRSVSGLPELYGYRSLSSDEVDYWWLKNRDLLNYVSVRAKQILTREVFKNADSRGHLFAAIATDLVGLLEPIRQAGGLYEWVAQDGQTVVDPGYSVDTGPDVNPPSSLQTQTVNARVGIRPAPAASLIQLTVSQSPLQAGV